MTQDEIIKIAHKAGLHIATDVNWMPIVQIEYVEKFANQIAEHMLMNIDPSSFMSYQEGMEAGRLAEREACADIAENWNSNGSPRTGVANEIRARGQA